MRDPIDSIVKEIKRQGEDAVRLRIGKVTSVPDATHVTVDFAGTALINRDRDIPAMAVGDRVYCLQHHGVVVVVGRLA